VEKGNAGLIEINYRVLLKTRGGKKRIALQ